MKTLKVGETVRIVRTSNREPLPGEMTHAIGVVTTITGTCAAPSGFDAEVRVGTNLYILAIVDPLDGAAWAAPFDWLEPFYPGKEPSADFRSAEDILASLRTTVKERIDG